MSEHQTTIILNRDMLIDKHTHAAGEVVSVEPHKAETWIRDEAARPYFKPEPEPEVKPEPIKNVKRKAVEALHYKTATIKGA